MWVSREGARQTDDWICPLPDSGSRHCSPGSPSPPVCPCVYPAGGLVPAWCCRLEYVLSRLLAMVKGR